MGALVGTADFLSSPKLLEHSVNWLQGQIFSSVINVKDCGRSVQLQVVAITVHISN